MAVTLLGGFVIGLALGCGSSKPPEASGGGNPAPQPGDAPKPIPKDELPAAEARLADLEKTITAKDKELADLRAEANALRKQIAAAKAPKDKVYRAGAELLADMPKDAYPKLGPEFGLERASARKWCKANLPGRTVEWTATVKEVNVSGNDPFGVLLTLDGVDIGHAGIPFGESFPLGGQPCLVGIDGSHLSNRQPQIQYPSCTAEEADRLRKLKGRKSIFRSQVVEADVGDDRWFDSITGQASDRLPIPVRVSPPSADGILPEADKPKSKGKE